MSDIVERLRSYALNVSVGVVAQAKETLTWQAADEIERLRAACNALDGEQYRLRAALQDAEIEIVQLRAFLNEARAALEEIARETLEGKK